MGAGMPTSTDPKVLAEANRLGVAHLAVTKSAIFQPHKVIVLGLRIFPVPLYPQYKIRPHQTPLL